MLRFVAAIAIIGGLAVGQLAAPAPASAFSCGPCPAVTTDALNLRDGPSLNAAVLLVMPAGAELEYDPSVPAQNGYVAVSYGSVEGYAHRLYLLLFPASASPTDWLNLRSGPSLSASVIMVMEPGSPVQVRSAADNRYFSVAYEQRVVGYAHGDYLDFESTGSFAAGDDAVVNTNALNLRTEAGLDGAVRAILFSGDDLTIESGPVETAGFTWYAVDSDRGAGWVAGEYLVRT